MCAYVDIIGQTVILIFFLIWIIPSGTLSMFLYLVSALDRLLVAKAMGQNALLCGHFISFLSCRSPSSKPLSL